MVYRCFGAIVGDVVGSRFEFNNCKSKEFNLFDQKCLPTDDTYMTAAVMEATQQYLTHRNLELLRVGVINSFHSFYRKYPNGGYGGRFRRWCQTESREPYNSLGNGAAMRVSPCAYISDDLDECLRVAKVVTEVTHNHASALFWVAVLTTIIFNLRTKNWGFPEFKSYVKEALPDWTHATLDEIRDDFLFDETCDGTVPVAIECVLEATSFEDAIRNAISLGGDSDTLAAIAGSIAQPLFGLPESIARATISRLPGGITMTAKRFSEATENIV